MSSISWMYSVLSGWSVMVLSLWSGYRKYVMRHGRRAVHPGGEARRRGTPQAVPSQSSGGRTGPRRRRSNRNPQRGPELNPRASVTSCGESSESMSSTSSATQMWATHGVSGANPDRLAIRPAMVSSLFIVLSGGTYPAAARQPPKCPMLFTIQSGPVRSRT